ncbi:uncharacterized protein LODBEIA_P26010 [Lodderomyces beijingensis]|uniref:Uncharacterized protein n=1 Tax=Lodderomyces beijingensis TaxID=1775926 RepID=A0ABP0ZLY0_9ASCO
MHILAFDTAWFLQPNQSFHVIRNLINKGYSKARKKYNVITSPRILSPETVLRDLGISANGDSVFIMYLLMDEDLKHGKRDFANEDLDSSFNCDVPFKQLQFADVAVEYVASDFHLVEDTLDSCIATLAFASMDNEPNAFELTCVASFMPTMGYRFLNYVLNEQVLPLEMLNRGRAQKENQEENNGKLVIIADCVVEHELVSYYEQKCKFAKVDQVLIRADDEMNLDPDVWWSSVRDFHLARVRRTILVRAK